MKDFRRIFILGVVCTILTACSGRHGTVAIRVVATTDVHGCVFDKDLVDGSDRPGNLCKVATLLDEERKNNRNVLYIDAGDALQGTIESYHDMTAQFDRTSLIAEAYNLLGCEALTYGNHDLSVSPQSYETFFRDLDCLALGANVCFDEYGDYMPVYNVIEKHGVRIGILGISTTLVNFTIPTGRNNGMLIRDGIETARHFVPILREKENVDVVIGLIHSGYEGGRIKDEGVESENFVSEMLNQVPGFDMIVYGHDHEAACFKTIDCNGDSVLLINPGPYAEKAGLATVYVDFSDPDKPKVRAEGCLRDITGLQPHKKFVKALKPWYDDVRCYADSVAGVISTPLDLNGSLWRTNTGMDYLHSLQMRYNSAQVSLTAPVALQSFFPAGEIRFSDLFKYYRYDNTLMSVRLKGSEIVSVLEYAADLAYSNPSETGHLLRLTDRSDGLKEPVNDVSAFISAAGIDYTIDINKPWGQRVFVKSMSDGTPFDPDAYYRTTLNSHQYGGSSSIVLAALGLSYKEMASRLIAATSVDIRYYMITDLTLNHMSGLPVRFRNVCSWKLVPEAESAAYLGKDTVNLSLIKQSARD